VRLVISVEAETGKGAELARAMQDYCHGAATEEGCEQFELFVSADDPDRLIVLERWADQSALDAHAQRNAAHPPSIPAGLRKGGEREDYEYRRTR
jgi:quinol monooxygenase YgiN